LKNEEKFFDSKYFENLTIHFLKEPVFDCLNNALNIIRDFYLEKDPRFPANAVDYMGAINSNKIAFHDKDKLTYSEWKMVQQTLGSVHEYISSMYGKMRA